MTLRIPLSIYEQLRLHLEAGYPNEACGALVGRSTDNTVEALEFVAMRNTIQDRPNDRYALDPLEQLKVQKEAERKGLEIVGFAHSHPDHPPRPSRFDTDHAWPFYSYVVAAVDNGVLREARAFRLDEAEKTFKEETLEVV